MAEQEIALLEMQLAATMAALHTFMAQNEKLLPQHREPLPLAEYFGSPKRPFTEEEARARVESNLVPSEVVGQPIDEEDTDSVLSAKEQAEQDRLFERIVVDSHEEKDKEQAVSNMSKLSDPHRTRNVFGGSIRWNKFEAIIAFRDEDWHSDIGQHLEENVQEYLDQYLDNGGVVTKASFVKTGEFGSTP